MYRILYGTSFVPIVQAQTQSAEGDMMADTAQRHTTLTGI